MAAHGRNVPNLGVAQRVIDKMCAAARRYIADETGEYDKGDIVFLDAHSVHTPRAVGDTLVLVFWPEGVRLIDK